MTFSLGDRVRVLDSCDVNEYQGLVGTIICIRESSSLPLDVQVEEGPDSIMDDGGIIILELYEVELVESSYTPSEIGDRDDDV